MLFWSHLCQLTLNIIHPQPNIYIVTDIPYHLHNSFYYLIINHVLSMYMLFFIKILLREHHHPYFLWYIIKKFILSFQLRGKVGLAHLFVILLHLLSQVTSEGKFKVRHQMEWIIQEKIPFVKDKKNKEAKILKDTTKMCE